MLKTLLLAGLAAAAFTPSLASAQSQCQEQRHDDRVVGTVVGAGLGALLGNAVSGHGGKPGGTIIGGVGGAVIGNQIAGGGSNRCGENQYGYYDPQGQWVPKTSTAYGYYGPDGRWVARDQNSYGQNGYNQPQAGYGQPAYGQPAYGQPAYGQNGYAPAPAYGQDAAYTDRDHRQMDFRDREDRMDQQIRQQMGNGQLDNRAGRHALRDLNDIRRTEADYRQGNDGHLNDQQRADIDHRLDALRDQVRSNDGDRRSY